MKIFNFIITFLIVGFLSNSINVAQIAKSKPTIVIVHGAWGGGWAFKQVDSFLTDLGYNVYRPTLTGQGEKVHLANQDVGLNTHILDIVNTVLYEELNDIILLGHSYGGLVVTGVADTIPNRISKLLYLDAFVPEDGESIFSARGDNNWGKVEDGYIIPAWVKDGQLPPSDVPHPLKTLTDKINLDNPDRLNISTEYILTVAPESNKENDGFYNSYRRAKNKNWPTHILEADHNPQWSAPNEFVELLDKIISRN